MPDTECDLCWYAEATRAEKIRRRTGELFNPSNSSDVRVWLAGSMAATMTALTGVSPPTWYERHREAWVQTGDPAELARMVRHNADFPPMEVAKPPAPRREMTFLATLWWYWPVLFAVLAVMLAAFTIALIWG